MINHVTESGNLLIAILEIFQNVENFLNLMRFYLMFYVTKIKMLVFM